MADIFDPFEPNQLGNASIMFNPAREPLDMNGFDILNCPNIGGGGGSGNVVGGAGITATTAAGTTTVSLQDISGSFQTNYLAGITVDTYGRVVDAVALGYIPAPFTSLQNYLNLFTGGTIVGQTHYIPPPGSPTELFNLGYGDSRYLNKVSGGNIGALTTYYTNTPTQNNELTTKLYVDNAIAAGGGGGSITVLGGNNITVNSTNPSQPVVNLDIKNAIDMNDEGLDNTSYINGSGLIFPIGSAGVLSLQSVAGLNLIGGGGISITTPGLLSMGSGNVLGGHSELEKVSFTENVIEPVSGGARLEFNGVDSINGISFTPDGTIQTGGTITSKDFQVGNPSHYTDITRRTNADPMITLSNHSAGTSGGVVDTAYNPLALTLSGTGNTTLNVQAKDGFGATTTMASIGLPTNLFIANNSLTSLTNGDIVNLTNTQANQIFAYNIFSGQATVNLPANAPVGASYFIYVSPSAGGSILVKTPIISPSADITLTANSGCIWVVNELIAGISSYVLSDSMGTRLSNYVPLAGTLAGSPITGAITVADTGSISCKTIQTTTLNAFASPNDSLNMNAKTNVNNDLGIYKAGTQLIEMGTSATDTSKLSMTYNPSVAELTINKKIVGSNLVLNGTGTGTDVLTVNTGRVSIGGQLRVNGASGGISINCGSGHLEMNGYNVQNAAAFTGNSATITTMNTTNLNATNGTFTEAPTLNKPFSYFSLPSQIPNLEYVNQLFQGGTGLVATGGVITDYFIGNSKYRAHVFTWNGVGNFTGYTFSITNPGTMNAPTFDCLILGGGGAGGCGSFAADVQGGGGGAGGYFQALNIPVYASATYPSNYSILVGRGGAIQTISGAKGEDGFASVLTIPADQTPYGVAVPIEVPGGGGGGATTAAGQGGINGYRVWFNNNNVTTDNSVRASGGGGGSGAGGANTTAGNAPGIVIYNRKDGLGADVYSSAFGGGVGFAGTNGTGGGGGGAGNNLNIPGASLGGNPYGGQGYVVAFDNTTRWVCGGGEGGRKGTASPSGASTGRYYGGGRGQTTIIAATSGAPNSGGGGGGSAGNLGTTQSGAGGSGLIVIRYRV